MAIPFVVRNGIDDAIIKLDPQIMIGFQPLAELFII
jgi:hypothetical protein